MGTEHSLPAFLRQLHTARSVSNVLHLLLYEGQTCDIASIRYYRFRKGVEAGQDEFYSVDSAGCSAVVEERVRLGKLQKQRRESEHDKSGSFCAIDARSPIAFKFAERDPPTPLRLEPPTDGLPLLQVAKDSIDEILLKEKASEQWIDVPLIVGDWIIGKLSCDIVRRDRAIESKGLYNSFRTYLPFVLAAAPVLETLRSHNISAPIREASLCMAKCNRVAEVAEFCTNLRKVFRCDNVDFFTSSIDSEGVTRLVLRRTTFKDAKDHENIADYIVNDRSTSLTAWSAHSGDSIRVHGLLDRAQRQRQLAVYSKNLRWESRVPLGIFPHNLMVVPIPIHEMPDGTRRFGIIRLADKRDLNGIPIAFDEQDESLLTKMVAQSIGPRLRSLMFERAATKLEKLVTQVNAIDLRQAEPWNALIDIAKECIKEHLEEGNKKQYVISRLLVGDRLEMIAKGGALPFNSAENILPVDGTLGGYALREGTTIYLSDLTKAATEGRYLALAPDAICAIASPIRYRNKDAGTIVVLSNRRDITYERDRALMVALAAEAGVLLEHARVAALTTHLGGASHDLHSELVILGREAQSVAGDLGKNLERRLEFLGSLVAVHSCSTPPTTATLLSKIVVSAVGAIVSDLISIVEPRHSGQLRIIASFDEHANEVHMVRDLLSVCVYHVLRNAAEYCCSKSCGEVGLDVRVDDREMRWCISNPFEGNVDHLRNAFDNCDGWIETDPWAPKRGNGFPIVKRMLGWYRFGGTARAQLSFDSGDEDGLQLLRITLTFPLPESDKLSHPAGDK